MKDVTYHNLTEKEALEYTAKQVDYGVALIVYSALNELLYSYALLQQSKYFVHTVKRRANVALKKRNLKVRELKHLVMHEGFSETYWDAVIDASEDDVSFLRAEIKATLDEGQIPDSELYSQLETTRVLLESAKIQYEEVIRECNNRFMTQNYWGVRNLNLFATFHEFYIDGIYKEWNTLCLELYKNQHRTVELTNERTMNAFNIIGDKFAKGLYIQECLSQAKKEFPEFAELEIKTT